MEQPEKIYLIDMGDEVVWCDSPSPAPGMEEKDTVEYRKSDMVTSEIDMLQRIIQRLAKIHKPRFKHLCHEWDGLEINEFCPEFDACTCYSEEEFDEGYHEFLQEMAVHCKCCPICSPGPCDGVLAGGMCDKECHCKDDSEW